MSEERKVAVITGASRGIGAAIACALLDDGIDTVVIGRSADRLRATFPPDAGTAGKAIYVAGDLGDPGDVDRMIGVIRAAADGLWLLAHCAALYDQGAWEETDVKVVDKLFGVNVRGACALTRGLLPLVIAARGDIVFMNSSIVYSAGRDAGPYAASKHALRGLADSLRAEVNEHGVRVLSIYPGRTATPMQEAIFAARGDDYRPDVLLQPDDIAHMVIAATGLARTAEVTDIRIRPMVDFRKA